MSTESLNPFMTLELSTVMTADEVADMLRLKVWTVQDLARRGEIPSFKIGKSRRFIRMEIEKYIAAQVAKGGR